MTKSEIQVEEGNSIDGQNAHFDYSTSLTHSRIHHSAVPDVCKSGEVVLGVDEAGRGPVLGPMVYAVCFLPKEKEPELKEQGVADSKTLTEEQREEQFEILNTLPWVGWSVNALSPLDISTSMLQKNKYNLNALAHDTTIGLIRSALDRGVNVTEIYVDTVGPPESYQRKLSEKFPGILIKVAKKADSLYPCVSAASICAKVTRDGILKNWVFAEKGMENISREMGSGYPSDPNTVNWLKKTIDPVFGYPNIIRFSWGTCEKLLDTDGVSVEWPEPEEEATPQITKFFSKEDSKSSRKRKNKTEAADEGEDEDTKDTSASTSPQKAISRSKVFRDNGFDVVTCF